QELVRPVADRHPGGIDAEPQREDRPQARRAGVGIAVEGELADGVGDGVDLLGLEGKRALVGVETDRGAGILAAVGRKRADLVPEPVAPAHAGASTSARWSARAAPGASGRGRKKVRRASLA